MLGTWQQGVVKRFCALPFELHPVMIADAKWG